jgi:lipopolysaccharide export system protein LptA
MLKKVFIISFLIGNAALASTVSPTGSSMKTDEAIIINGDTMDYDTGLNKSTVVGNARAERGSGAQKHILTAKRFDVYFKNKTEKSENSSQAGGDIQEIKAIGDATLVKESDKLTVKADYCFYRPGEGKGENKPDKIEFIECQNNVKLTKEDHYLEGDKAVIDINTGIYKVTSKKRVRGILKPPSASKSTLKSTPLKSES